MTDSKIVTNDVIMTLLGAHSYIADVYGFGKGTCEVLDRVPLTTLTECKTASEAGQKCFGAIRQIIDEICANDYKGWMRIIMDDLLQEGEAKGWTIRDIMKRLNRIVGKQHALDGKLFEALIIIILTHFLGRENVELVTQAATGARLGGRTDIEAVVGGGRFLIEAKTKLGVDWKRSIIEHCVMDGKGNYVQQPFFLVTEGFTLKESWVKEMKDMGCQPVTLYPSVVSGVIHLDALVGALKKEIEKAKEPKKTSTV
jgi:hypothetical protein